MEYLVFSTFIYLLNVGLCLSAVDSSAGVLTGSIGLFPFPSGGNGLEAGGGLSVDVNVNLTAMDSLSDISIGLECVNAQPNLTSDVWASYSTAHYAGASVSSVVPSTTQDVDNSLIASYSVLNLAVSDVIELQWQAQWNISDSATPALVISCDIVVNFTNSSSDALTESFFGDADYTLAPNVTLQNADGTPYDGSSTDSELGVGEQIALDVVARVPKGVMQPEVKVEPDGVSNDTIAATWLSIANASSRITCGEFTGLNCRPRRADLASRAMGLTFFDEDVSVAGDDPPNEDLVVRSVLRVGDDGVSDGDTASVIVSLTSARSHVWTHVLRFNVSDDGSPRATDMEVEARMVGQSLNRGDDATVSVKVSHAAGSRASGQDVALHVITAPSLVYSSVDAEADLTEPPIVSGSLVILKIGNLSLFSSKELSINLTVDPSGASSGVSRHVGLVQAIYKNDTTPTASRDQSVVRDFRFQFGDAALTCEEHWQPFDSSCYRVNATHRLNAAEASQTCVQQGGVLASIDSIFEERFLVDISPTNLTPYRFWVSENSTHLNWFHGQPDGSGACPSLVVAGSYWLDSNDVIGDSGLEATDCSETRFFICEMPVIDEAPPEVNSTRQTFFGMPSASEALTDGFACPCPYPSPDPTCACCEAGATLCLGPGHRVCISNHTDCPVPEFFDRSVLLDGTGLRVACDNVQTSPTSPRCVFSNSSVDEWNAFPPDIGDVIAYHNETGTVYALARDALTYMKGTSGGVTISDWLTISADEWMSAISGLELTFHQLVTSSDYSNGDMITWNCCG